jgi:hypothetical protein
VAPSRQRCSKWCSPTSSIPTLIIRVSKAMVLLQQRQIYNLDIVFYCLSGKVLSYRQNQCLTGENFKFPAVLTDKRRIHLRSASVRTYTFFTTGFPRFLSIRGARGLQAFDLPILTNYSNPNYD